MSNHRVLITGASSGIGESLARVYAQKGHSLILVARQQEKLVSLSQNLQEKYHVQCLVVVQDLSLPDSVNQVINAVKNHGLFVHTLINNAGFGYHGAFCEAVKEYEQEMIQVNISALVQLTKKLLPEMVEKKCGSIINIGSVYSYVPVPEQALYAASKAFVLSLSVALHQELKHTGVQVLCVCPGSTQTHFHQKLKLELSEKKFMMSAGAVAEQIYQAEQKRKLVYVPGWYNKIFTFIMKLLPVTWSARVVGWIVYRLRKTRKLNE